MKPSFLFLSANTAWVYALARSLAANGDVTAIRFYDWVNFGRLKPKWPEEVSAVRRKTIKLPPGYAGRFEILFRFHIQKIISYELKRLRLSSNSEPIVVCPYPYLAPWLRRVPDRNVVYYNLDDYALYDPTRAVKTAQLEKEIVQRARISFCLSLHQVEALRSKYPDAARRIVHFPLGVDEKFLNPKPDLSPLPKTVGYVGNLTNRVDWKLVGNVADALPDIAFKFIGSLNKINDGNDDSSWKADRQASLGRKNVEFLGEVPQNKVMEHYWQYSVNWMPYDTRHPFNIASCPTKIMDALASGRPFVSTKIPEVLSLSDRVYVATDARHAANLIRSAIEGEINHNTADQLVFAKRQTWEIRAKEMLVHLDSNAYET